MSAPLFKSALLVAATAALGACSTYDGYGYSGVSVGYGSPYYDYYPSSYYGWYDDYYYPGTGYYIYDRSGHRHRWNDSHRRYWESRRGQQNRRDNWSGYRGDRDPRWNDGRNRPDRPGYRPDNRRPDGADRSDAIRSREEYLERRREGTLQQERPTRAPSFPSMREQEERSQTETPRPHRPLGSNFRDR